MASTTHNPQSTTHRPDGQNDNLKAPLDPNFHRRNPEEIPDTVVAAVQKSILQEALRVGRGQTMMLGSKAHVVALTKNRTLLLEELKASADWLESFIHKVQVGIGPVPESVERLARLRKFIADEEGM